MSNSPVQIPLAIGITDLEVLLQTSERTIHRLNVAGRIPKPCRLGGQLRWRLAEIEAWVAAGMPPRQRWEQIRAKCIN